MKKLLPLILFSLICSQAWGATYYVREDGGNNTQCTGLADAPYDGSGSGEACAWNHPWWAIKPVSGTIALGASDTLIIDGTGQNGYQMGIADGNKTARNAGACAMSAAYDCYMQPPPSGTSEGSRTKIYGKGWDTGCANPPELWGSGRTGRILNISGSDNLDVRCLEITDHFQGVYLSGPHPNECRHASPYDQNTGYNGIRASGSTNVNLHDVNIHGLCLGGLDTNNLDNWDFTRVTMQGNGFVGWDGDIGGVGNHDNITLDTVKIKWSGCVEEYPIVSATESDRYFNCVSQDLGGFGDGIGLASGTCVNWVIRDSDISFNTSDGIDLLYCDKGTNNSIDIDRTIIAGNGGNQLKTGRGSATGGMDVTIDDTVIIGECSYFNSVNTGKDCNLGDCKDNFNNCRAQGNPLTIPIRGGRTVTITNSTITTEGDAMFSMGGDNSCDGTESINIRNSILMGERDFLQQFENSAFHWNGSDSGLSCATNGSHPITLNLTNVYAGNFKNGNPGGTNVTYNTNPQLTNLTVAFSSTGTLTYGSGISTPLASDGLKPAGGSPVIGASNETYGTGVDFYNESRGVAYDLGAMENETVSGPVCVNNTKETGETCDGTDLGTPARTCADEGFSGGTLSCSANCQSFVTTACTLSNPPCGNGDIDSEEQCDTTGPNLNGQTCISQGYASGSLACTASTCLFDVSGCVAHACQDSIVHTSDCIGGNCCDDGNATEGDGCSSLCTTENPNYELFLNYTDTDPNNKTAISVHRNEIAGLTRTESANLKKDMGVGNIGELSYDFYYKQLLAQSGGTATIAYDAGNQATQDLLSSITFSHTVAAGDNRLLVVAVTNEDGGSRTISSVTFNGDAMTLATGINGANNDVYIYYLLAPDVATGNVVVTWSGEVYGLAASADSFTEIAQQAPEVIGTSTTGTVELVTQTSKSLIFSTIMAATSTATLTTSDTELHNFVNTGSHAQGVSYKIGDTAGSNSMIWNVSMGSVISTAAVFAPANTGGANAAIIGIASIATASYASIPAQDTGDEGFYLLADGKSSTAQTVFRLKNLNGANTEATCTINNVSPEIWGNINRTSPTLTATLYTDVTRTTQLTCNSGTNPLSVTTDATAHRYLSWGMSYNDSVSGTSVSAIIGDADITAGQPAAGGSATQSITITGQNLTISWP